MFEWKKFKRNIQHLLSISQCLFVPFGVYCRSGTKLFSLNVNDTPNYLQKRKNWGIFGRNEVDNLLDRRLIVELFVVKNDRVFVKVQKHRDVSRQKVR